MAGGQNCRFFLRGSGLSQSAFNKEMPLLAGFIGEKLHNGFTKCNLLKKLVYSEAKQNNGIRDHVHLDTSMHT